MTETDDGIVLLQRTRGRYWHLNAAASDVLHRLLAGEGVDGTVRSLTERHRVPASRVSADVRALLDGLYRARLVSR